MSKSIGISFGALMPPLKEQLREQGLKFKSHPKWDLAEVYEADRQAIVRLKIHSYITDAQATSAFRKLLKAITRDVERAIPNPTWYGEFVEMQGREPTDAECVDAPSCYEQYP